jgi:integrase
VLEPLWQTKPETATRVRGRIEAVLDWATVRTYRTGENPARWRGHLDKLLPSKSRIARVKHHAALPYAELPAFMAELRQHEGIGARALEFVILTAARTGEAIGAQWSKIDRKALLWTVPGERMKSGRAHRVPLSEPVIEILSGLRGAAESEFLFPGGRIGHSLSNMALLQLMRGMRPGFVPHGFRSTFRDWAAEQTDHSRDVAEAALAHVVGDKTEAAYRRGDALEKRRALMVDWAAFCATF